MLEFKNCGCNIAHTIVFSDSLSYPKIIFYHEKRTIVAWNKTFRNTNVLIHISTVIPVSDTDYECIGYKENGFTVVLQFPKHAEHADTLYQDVKSILTNELREQLQRLERSSAHGNS